MTINKTTLFLFLIIIIGSIFRLYNITAISLWHDEAFSALLIHYPFGEMIDRIILDVHPPFYYILLRIWDFVLGDSLLMLRLFSMFFGVLTIFFTYLFVKTAFKNEQLSLVSAAFIAINSFQIQYSIEARMYTLGTFLVMLSSYLLVKAIEEEKYNLTNNLTEKIKQYRWWILYGISATLALYTHYYLIFSVIAQVLFVAFLILRKNGLKIKEWFKNKKFKGVIIAYTISFIMFFPWLPILLKQLNQVQKNYWIPTMNSYSIPNTIFHIFSGTNINTNNFTLILVSLIFIVISIIVLKREKNKYKWLVFFSFFIPFMIPTTISFKRSLYLDRYFVFIGLFYFIILALFLKSIKNNIIKNIILIILIISSVLLFFKNWNNINPKGKPGMSGASEYLFENAAPQDKVYINSTFIFFTYKYYSYRHYFSNEYPINFNPSKLLEKNNVFNNKRIHPEYLTPLIYTPGLTSLNQIPHFSGRALLTKYDLLTNFNKDIKKGDNVWIIWTTGFGGSKPKTPSNWQQISEAGFQDVFDYRGWIIVTKYKVQ